MRNAFQTIKTALLAAILVAGVQVVYAQFQGPPTDATPATYNVAAPINKNAGGNPGDIQSLTGTLSLNGLRSGKIWVDANLVDPVNGDIRPVAENFSNETVEFLQVDATREPSPTLNTGPMAQKCGEDSELGRLFYNAGNDELYLCADYAGTPAGIQWIKILTEKL